MNRSTIRHFIVVFLNTYAITLFSSFGYFYLKDFFASTIQINLFVSAVTSIAYCLGSLAGGITAGKFGPERVARAGFISLALSLVSAASVPYKDGLVPFVLCLVFAAFSHALTWPALETLVVSGEASNSVETGVGWYNISWASANGLGYLTGGFLYDTHPLVIFLLPAVLAFINAAVTAPSGHKIHVPPSANFKKTKETHPANTEKIKNRLLITSYIANLFAYMAISTLIPVIPDIAAKFRLSASLAGVFYSLWFFTRCLNFTVMTFWHYWRYRLTLLVLTFVTFVISYFGCAFSSNILIASSCFVVFGWSVGFIYFSSLFYSMDRESRRSEYGGIHESVLGFGSAAGPIIGAIYGTSLSSSLAAVGVLILTGLLLISGLSLKELSYRNKITVP